MPGHPTGARSELRSSTHPPFIRRQAKLHYLDFLLSPTSRHLRSPPASNRTHPRTPITSLASTLARPHPSRPTLQPHSFPTPATAHRGSDMPRLGHDSCNSNEATPGKSQVATFRSGTRRSSRLPFSPGVNLSRSSIHRAIEAEPNRTSWQALGASEHPGTAARGSSPVRLDASGSIDDRRSRGGKGRSSKKANQGRSVQSIRSTQAMLIDEVRTARASWGSQPLPPGQVSQVTPYPNCHYREG